MRSDLEARSPRLEENPGMDSVRQARLTSWKPGLKYLAITTDGPRQARPSLIFINRLINMNETDNRLIEAWFDGEASPEDSAKTVELLKSDSEAKAYLETLKSVRKSLKDSYPESTSPVSWAEVYDSVESTEHRKVVSFPRIVSAVAAILVLGMALWYPMRQAGREVPAMSFTSSVEMVETDLEGATPVVYLDQPSGWTVVWVVEESEFPDI